MVVLRRLVPESPYPARLGGDPRLALEVFAVSQAHYGTAAVLRAIDHRLDHRCAVQGVCVLSQRSVNATFSGWSRS